MQRKPDVSMDDVFARNSRVITRLGDVLCIACNMDISVCAILLKVDELYEEQGGGLFPLAIIPLCASCAMTKHITYEGSVR